jgi:hypothetical protein
VIRRAHERYDDTTIRNHLWPELAAVLSPQELLELVVTAGWYRTNSYVLNAVRIQREDSASRLPAFTARSGVAADPSWDHCPLDEDRAS